MSSVRDCIFKKAEIGRLTKGQAKQLDEELARMEARFQSGDATQNELAAAKLAISNYQYRWTKRQEVETFAINAKRRGSDIANAMGERGRTASEIIDAVNHNTGKDAMIGEGIITETFGSVQQAYYTQYLALVDQVIQKISKGSGIRFMRDAKYNAETVIDLWNLVYKSGQRSTTPDVAKSADLSFSLTKRIRADLDAAGLEVLDRDDYIFGSFFQKQRLAQVGKSRFVDTMVNLDFKPEDGFGIAFSSIEQKRVVLGALYDDLIDSRNNRVKDYVNKGLRNLGASRKFNRIFKFGNPEDWMKAQEAFGYDNLYSLLVNYAHQASTEMAQLKVYGPRPEQWKAHMISELTNLYPGQGDAIKNRLEQVMDFNINKGINPEYLDTGFNKINSVISGIRTMKTLLSAAHLGGTAGNALLTDTMTNSAVARAARGWTELNDGLIQLKGIFSKMNREDLARLNLEYGIAAHSFLDNEQRRLMEISGRTWEGAADKAFRVFRKAAGIDPVTRGNINGPGYINLMHLADDFLDSPSLAGMKNTDAARYLKMVGLTEAEFKAVKEMGIEQAAMEGLKGKRPIINPSKLFRSDDKIAQDAGIKITRFIQQAVEESSPSSSPYLALSRYKAQKAGGATAITSEMTNFLFGYFSSFYHNVLGRIINDSELSGLSKGVMLASLTTRLFIGMYVYNQIMNVLKLKDPEPLSASSVSKAALQLTPLLGGMLDRSVGGSYVQTPFLSLEPIDKLLSLTMGNVEKAYNGKELTVGKDALAFGTMFIPGQNIWFGAGLYKRYAYDNMLKVVDPKANETFRKQRQYARKEGTAQWWESGDLAPRRLPDLGNAFKVGKK